MLVTITDDFEIEAESLEDLERQMLEAARQAWEDELRYREEAAERKMAVELGLLPKPTMTVTEALWADHIALWLDHLAREASG